MIPEVVSNKDSLLNRRSFLQSVSAGVTALSLASLPSRAWGCDTETPLKAILDSFPEADKIPGIARVEKIYHPESSKILCILEQVHWVPDISNQDLNFAKACQKELLDAYGFLQNYAGAPMKSLYVEGLFHGAEEEGLKPKRQEVNKHFKLVSQSKKTQHSLQSADRALAQVGAAEVLGIDGSLVLIGAEDKETYLKTFELEKKDDKQELDLYLFKKREDALLSIASKDSNPVLYCVYGASHNFRDNVEEFNKNEKTKFSLLLITPSAVIGYREKEARPKWLDLPLPEARKGRRDFLPF